MQKQDILRKVPLFSKLAADPEALAALSGLMVEENFSKGHILLKEGELGDRFYILIKGRVSIEKKTPDGTAYRIVILEAAKTPALGEGGLVEAEPRSATVACEEDCSFMVLSREAFVSFSKKQPQWAVPVLQELNLQLMKRLHQVSLDVALLHKALMNEIRG